MIGNWRKLHNGELHVLCYSKNIIQAIKLRRMRWARHVESGDEEECVQGFGEVHWRKVKTVETWTSVAGY
jgi:hypothetical protein